MARATAIVLLVLCASPSLNASDRGLPRLSGHLHTTAEHFGDSPFAPADVDDTRFVLDDAFDLDTGCTFRSGGPLVIHLKIGRYVGAVKGDQTLAEPTRLIAKNLISRTAHLRMPVYDVDVRGDPDDPRFGKEYDSDRL